VIRVTLDGRLQHAALVVARAVGDDIRRVAPRDGTGTVYLGAGSVDLIGPSDARPHVIVPLTRGRWLDTVVRDQIGHTDAVVTMDEAEMHALAPMISSRSAVVLVSTVASSTPPGVIRTGNPFDAAEVQAFRRMCPTIAWELDRHGVPLDDFSPRPVTIAVLEAFEVAQGPKRGDRPRSPDIDSSR
jgi:hypothetical protein